MMGHANLFEIAHLLVSESDVSRVLHTSIKPGNKVGTVLHLNILSCKPCTEGRRKTSGV